MKKNIFVCYSVRDGLINKDVLKIINCILQDSGNVFIDMLHNDYKHPQKKVIFELLSADVFVLLLTSGVLKSPWALLEINIAIKRKMPFWIIKENQLIEIIDLFNLKRDSFY